MTRYCPFLYSWRNALLCRTSCEKYEFKDLSGILRSLALRPVACGVLIDCHAIVLLTVARPADGSGKLKFKACVYETHMLIDDIREQFVEAKNAQATANKLRHSQANPAAKTGFTTSGKNLLDGILRKDENAKNWHIQHLHSRW